MKLKEGMYVRTKVGMIAKCTCILEDCSYDFDENVYKDNFEDNVSFMEIPYQLIDKYIKKASFNIIDLIEVGDYVNGDKIGYIDDCKGAMRQFNYDYEDPSKDVGHWDEEIESVVTKEQFENLEYQVGENNDKTN